MAGLISASSMPLGAITSLLWIPRNRTTALLMAFGAGALLAALVIDLVGGAREKGHLIELGAGSVLGSLFYTAVNRLVNEVVVLCANTLLGSTMWPTRNPVDSYVSLVSLAISSYGRALVKLS
ncbi:MAG: hypothetical protein R6U00_03350 [Prochlorococcaceae cyanobacterium]